jgi:hypothetical protein
MNRFNPKFDSISERARRAIRRFRLDEGGATMTEFIITLPVFILIFAGVATLSRLNRAVVRTGGVAYSEMWDNALEVQLDDPGTHTSVRHSGSAIKANMRVYRDKQPDRFVRQVVRRETNAMGNRLRSKGTLGESAARVNTTQNEVKLRYIHADVTPNIGGVVGESRYARRLFDDGPSAPTFSGNPNGRLGDLGSMVRGSGTRMVHATAARYGEEVGAEVETVTVAGQPIRVYQYYSTLVSPHWQREDVATAVARTAMSGISPYDNLLGIAERQRLPKASQSVDKIKGAFE